MSASTSRLRSMVDEQIGKNATSGDSDSQSSSDTQQLTKEDVQEAVREGVAEALGDRDVDDASTNEGAASDEDSSGGRFTLKRLLVFATIATISYLVRRRRRSGNEDSQSDQP